MSLKLSVLLAFVVLISLSIAGLASAQKYQPAGDAWITKWWGLNLVTNNGGFNESAKHDYLKEGTGGKFTHESASTMAGLPGSNVVVKLPAANGGDLRWKTITINPDDGRNISTSHGKVDETNVTWHGIIVINSPTDRKTKIHPAHDDYAQIWINGKLVYDNPNWTTGAKLVTKPTDVTLNKGDNALLFKCGESGGDDYVNLHFEKTDADLKILPDMDGKFLEFLVPVEPKSKLTTTWGGIKRNF